MDIIYYWTSSTTASIWTTTFEANSIFLSAKSGPHECVPSDSGTQIELKNFDKNGPGGLSAISLSYWTPHRQRTKLSLAEKPRVSATEAMMNLTTLVLRKPLEDQKRFANGQRRFAVNAAG